MITKPLPHLTLDRREALLGVAVVALTPAYALAQATSPKVPVPVANPTAARTLRLRAEAHVRKIGTPEQPESRLFRLSELNAEGKPVTSGFPAFRAKAGEALTL